MDAVEEVKSRLSIEDVASQYMELKRAGRNFKALSPFANEKTASFIVSPDKQIWHDFSSGKGGDMFSLVMELEGLDFKAALELLARQAGVELAEFRGSNDGARGKQKERLYEALEMAAKFYQIYLSRHAATLDYVLKKRAFTKQTATAFRLGYAPMQDAALTTFLTKKGFTQSELKAAGLSTQRYKGLSDMFRGRLMVPLMDGTGRVIGFTARLLSDDPQAPKYINTPASPLYDKSRHVFGLHLAKEAIRKSGFVVVAEGNLDVIASYQAGVQNVVATAGTAMTEQHLKILSRLTSDVRLAYDQDPAGLAATERSIPLAAKVGIALSIITVPEGKDPDELIRKSPGAWEKAVQKPSYAVDWVIERYKQLLDIESGQGKRLLSDKVLATVRSISDSVEQDHYIIQLSELLQVSRDALREKLDTKTVATPKKRPVQTMPPPKHKDQEAIKTQNKLLALTLALPSLRTYLEPITASMMHEAPAKELLTFLQQHPEFNDSELPSKLHGTQEYATILQLLYEELYRDLEIIELRYEATRLQIRLVEQYVKIKKKQLAEAFGRANAIQTDELLARARYLDELLHSVKGQQANG